MMNRLHSDISANAGALGLYVHVPFCQSKCPYCDFCSRPPEAGEMDRYVSALKREFQRRASDRPVRTLYVGGGTPSLLRAESLCCLLDFLGRTFRIESDCEITVEANPADVSDDWLTGCRAAGVNRLSLGVQGMREDDLTFLGRRHTIAEAIRAAHCARAAGFDNLGIDLIVGLPHHTPTLTQEILGQAVDAFAPEHVSCYQLTCASGTPLHDAVTRGEVRMPDGDMESAIFMTVHEVLGKRGYEGYEVSNFSRTRELRSRHNSAYWTGHDYLGFGPSAHSFLNPQRAWNTTSLTQYCTLLEQGELPVEGREQLTDVQRAAEIILLGLRTCDGFSLNALRENCGVDLLSERAAVLESALANGLLHPIADRIQPTLRGMAVADRLAVDLAPDGLSG